jgi:hypothetical protein
MCLLLRSNAQSDLRNRMAGRVLEAVPFQINEFDKWL